MKALILKDTYVLWKKTRIFIAIVLVLSMVNSTFNCVFLVVWSSMLPYTAMAYDEQSHWDQLARMMPYSTRDLVLSRYALGGICTVLAGGFCFLIQTVMSLVSFQTTSITTLLASLCAGIIALDITLPAMMRFGVERGRMVFMLTIFAAAILGGIVADEALNSLPHFPISVALGFLALAAAIATAVSIPLSLKLYRTK